MNVALMGSVSSSYFALDALLRAGVSMTGVLGVDDSQKDRISDFRSLEQLAIDHHVPFQSFVKMTDPGVERFLLDHAPDLLWVIGLSQIVPDRLIDIARHGGVGFHPTMLPKGRGRAPVAWSILRNEPAAANLFFMTDEPDAGDIIIQREVPVRPDDYSTDLIQRTNEVLAEAIADLAPAIKAGSLPRTPQDHARATYYPKRTPEDGLIDWSKPTDRIYALVRAAGRPYPGAFTTAKKRKVIVWRAEPATRDEMVGQTATPPGSVLTIEDSRGPLVRTGDGGLWITELQCADGDAVSVRAGMMLR